MPIVYRQIVVKDSLVTAVAFKEGGFAGRWFLVFVILALLFNKVQYSTYNLVGIGNVCIGQILCHKRCCNGHFATLSRARMQSRMLIAAIVFVLPHHSLVPVMNGTCRRRGTWRVLRQCIPPLTGYFQDFKVRIHFCWRHR